MLEIDTAVDVSARLKSELHTWRTRVIDALLIAVAIAAAPLIGSIVVEAARHPQQRLAALTFAVLYSLVALLAILRRLSTNLRVWGLLTVCYTAGVLAFARGGLAGDGRLYLLTLPVLALTLAGVASGLFMAALSVLTFTAFAATAHLGWMAAWLVRQENTLILSDWVNGGVAFVLALVVLLVVQWRFSRFQQTLVIGQASLEQQRERLRAFSENIVQCMEEGVILEDATGHIVLANRKIAELLGHTPEDLIGQHWKAFAAPEDVAKVEQETAKRPAGIVSRYEASLLARDGRRVPVIVSARPLFEDGHLSSVLAVLTDITEQKQAETTLRRARDGLESRVRERNRELAQANEALRAEIAERERVEEALRESEAVYRTLVQTAPDAVTVTDLTGEITFVSGGTPELYGFEGVDDLLGMNAIEMIAPEDRDRALANMQKTLEEGVIRNVEYALLRKDGTRFPGELSAALIEDANGQPQAFIATVRDITHRKRAEAEREQLLNAHEHLSTQLCTATEVSKSASRILDPDELMTHAVNLIREQFGLRYVGVFLVDGTGEHAVLRAGAGEAVGVSSRLRVGDETLVGQSIAQAESRIRFVVSEDANNPTNGNQPTTLSEAALPLVSRGQECIGALTVQTTEEVSFSGEDTAVLRTVADQLAIAIDNARLYRSAQREIAKHKRTQEMLEHRSRELALLNRAGQAVTSTLDLDQVLSILLEEVRRLLDVVGSSVWLIDSQADELVCQQATGPKASVVRHWRLAMGEGIVGWSARTGESAIVPDVLADERHYRGLDEETGLDLRSIVATPVRVKDRVIGVLQAVDSRFDRFETADLTLLKPLAASAAIAIENARLYEQARRDAETKLTLLREVNHRTKNNLSSIIGLLYAARRHVEAESHLVYRSILNDLLNRLQGLATVNDLLSESEWAPLLLSEMAAQVIHSSLKTLSSDQWVSVRVTPSPVRITPDQAHDLALIVNELTSNAVKHALQDRSKAEINVRIAAEDDEAMLEFQDDGPGYPEEVLRMECSNVGIDLMRNIVRRSLRGELSLRNDHGATTTIRFEVGGKEKEGTSR